MLQDGQIAPDFELPDAGGKLVKLSELRGRPVVLFFYPKDDTSGCTAEAKDFTSLAKQFRGLGAEVAGISPDSPASHCKFRDKHGLGVQLISDEAKQAAQSFGVWVEKSMYGRRYLGVERSTFLIGSTGKIIRIWRKVKVPGHAEEVLAAVKAINSQG